MAYILNKTDGTALVTVLDNATTGTDYSVTFIGKNYLPYGETLNESLLHLLENSASVTTDRPENPVIGQTWYNKTDKSLYVCYQERAGTTPARFRALAKSNIGNSAPVDPSDGDLWYDPITKTLKVYTGAVTGWVTVGPAKQSDWSQTDATSQDYIKNRPAAFTADVTVKDEGTILSAALSSINFTGAGITASLVSGSTNSILVNVPGFTSSLQVKDDGNSLSSSVTSIDFVGNGVTATASTGAITVTIPGASAVGTVSVGSTAPLSPTVGQLWYENASIGRGFVYDGTQWVDFSPAIGGTSTTTPTAPTTSPSAVASTSFTLATTDGSAKSMGVVLTPGTWQVILDTRLITINDYNHDNELTQIATVGSVTVTTKIRTNRGGGAGHGRSSLGSSDIAVGEFTLTVDTAVVMAMQAAVPGDTGMQSPVGSTLTVSKIASTDAQKLYSSTMPTFTPPSASGIGVGQTWQNVTSSRASDTPYQNTTGAPIMVVVLPNSYNNVGLFVSSDNSNWVYIGNGAAFSSSDNSIGAIVPNQHWYKTAGNHRNWAELR
jgi:hypothetical protein